VTFGVRSVSPKLAKDIPEDFDPGRLAIHRGDFTKETLLGMGGLVVGGAAAALDPEDVENPVERLRRRIFTRPETSRARALRGAAALALGIFVALSPSSPFNRGDPHRRLSGLLRHQRAARGASGKGGRGRRSSARRARPPPLPCGGRGCRRRRGQRDCGGSPRGHERRPAGASRGAGGADPRLQRFASALSGSTRASSPARTTPSPRRTAPAGSSPTSGTRSGGS
jgi:hypothetical protein